MKLAFIAPQRVPFFHSTPMTFKVWTDSASERLFRSAAVGGLVGLCIWCSKVLKYQAEFASGHTTLSIFSLLSSVVDPCQARLPAVAFPGRYWSNASGKGTEKSKYVGLSGSF
jgi:hypothetical protein